MRPTVAVITDDGGWHGERLSEAFAARGFATRFASLTDCELDLATGSPGVRIPGFADRLPDGVFVRGVPGGTLEQVVFHLDILHALDELGVLVYNDGRGIERSVDKALASFRLARAGLPIPATRICARSTIAQAAATSAHRQEQEVVSKPLFGSRGEGLARLQAGDSLPVPASVGGIYYLQQYLAPNREGTFRDWRVLVVGGQAVAAMRREGSGWIRNVAQGARCFATRPDGALGALAERATGALELAYGGVDLLEGPDGGYQVIEVNGIPAWKGLQSVCPHDIAGLLVADFLDRLGAGHSGPREAAG